MATKTEDTAEAILRVALEKYLEMHNIKGRIIRVVIPPSERKAIKFIIEKHRR